MLRQLWTMFQKLTETVMDQLALFRQEVPSSNAMKMGPDHASGRTRIDVVQTDGCKWRNDEGT
jgi:hypothetical protein